MNNSTTEIYNDNDKIEIFNQLKNLHKTEKFYFDERSALSLLRIEQEQNLDLNYYKHFNEISIFLFDYFLQHNLSKEDFSSLFKCICSFADYNNTLLKTYTSDFSSEYLSSTYGDYPKYTFNNKEKNTHPYSFFITNRYSNKTPLVSRGAFLLQALITEKICLNSPRSLKNPHVYHHLKKSAIEHSSFHIETNQDCCRLKSIIKTENLSSLLTSIDKFQQKYSDLLIPSFKRIINHENAEFISPLFNISTFYENGFFVLSNPAFSEEEKNKLLFNAYYSFDSMKKSRIYNPIINTFFNLANNLFTKDFNFNLEGSLFMPQSYSMSVEDKLQILNDFLNHPLASKMIKDEINKTVKTKDYHNLNTVSNYHVSKFISQEVFDLYSSHSLLKNLSTLFRNPPEDQNTFLDKKPDFDFFHYHLFAKNITAIEINNIDVVDTNIGFFALFNQKNHLSIKSYFQRNLHVLDKFINSPLKIILETEFFRLDDNTKYAKILEIFPNTPFANQPQFLASNLKHIVNIIQELKEELHAFKLRNKLLTIDNNDKTISVKRKL